MYDIHVILSNSPGSLGAMGMALGNNGVGLEGGGVFTTPDAGHAHFLVEDGETARRVLTEAGFTVSNVCRPLIRKLPQERPGELGDIADTLAHNGIKEGANKQVISSQADSLIKISRIWADFFPANTSNQPI
ncbi:amino acid-binding protein [Klebsiella pneumoniae]|uniref:amino acid-binding protein n=1 Tax=Klebsiella pneumoniae TaxID=573 RepID=UPI00062D5A1E|nr:amino acid-binding protein [Klebsiella pneumoniae]KLA40587.1 amino acid-binding protein [Klebsiella pneumoniae subsp. pneumoniae]